MLETRPIQSLQLIYDGDCPFCSRYVAVLRVRRQVRHFELLNAREHPELVQSFRTRGMEINTGMIAVLDGVPHHGDAAMTVMAGLSTPSDLLNRLNAWLFRSPRVSKIIYPALSAGRRLTLTLLGRKTID